MNDRELDELFASTSHEVDASLLSRVSASMNASLTPVRPLPPAWVLVGRLMLISSAVAILSAGILGMHGFRKLSGEQSGWIFTILAIFILLFSVASVGAMTPGSRPWGNPLALLAVAVVGWLAIDALLFQDYSAGRFVPEGIRCLIAGLVVAVPAGVGAWLTLRRGFAVDPPSAGLIAGALAGFAGLAMLELHCQILVAPHIMFWHTSVVPFSALAGMLLARKR